MHLRVPTYPNPNLLFLLHKKSDTTCFSSVEFQLRAKLQLWSDG